MRVRISKRTIAPTLNRSRAFTLIELMVVIVIIGVMGALIVPEMSGTFGDSKIKSSARKIIQAAGLAQSRAVSINHEHRLQFDTRNHRFSISRRVVDPNLGETFVPVNEISGTQGTWSDSVELTLRDPAVDPDEIPLPTWELSDPLSIQSQSTTSEPESFISFKADGSTSRKELVLKHSDGHGLVISILPATGRMSIQPLKEDF
jgi:type II secretion system protein H